jgi:hypothetical protein
LVRTERVEAGLCIYQATAKKLGMTVPLLLLGRADEVFE